MGLREIWALETRLQRYKYCLCFRTLSLHFDLIFIFTILHDLITLTAHDPYALLIYLPLPHTVPPSTVCPMISPTPIISNCACLPIPSLFVSINYSSSNFVMFFSFLVSCSHVENQVLCEISPLTSYEGEGLEGLRGKRFESPLQL